MDHAQIAEADVIDRYLQGKLDPAEATSFEQHYLSCPECLDRLELAERMHGAFKRAASEDAARHVAVRQLAVVAWLARLGRSRQAAVLAMTLVACLAIPGILSFQRVGELDRELSATRKALESEKGKSAGSASLQHELASERQAREKATAELAEARQPQGNVPILYFNAERDATAGQPPSHLLHLSPQSRWIVLSLEIDPPHQSSYRVALRGARGQEIWSAGGLQLDAHDSLNLSLPASLLAPGDYHLVVEGQSPGRKPLPAGRFTFRVLPPA
ncbi:MAG: zf-HC2 domain-containing protein [Thermoanaerobaculia bacterium]